MKLIPPDRTRCQAEKKEGAWPDAQHFMIIGPAVLVRCINKPSVIVKETTKGKDGRKGSMALCPECLTKALQQLGPDAFTIKELCSTLTPKKRK